MTSTSDARSFPPYVADEALIAAVRASSTPRVRVYRPSEVMVVLGRGSRAEQELDLGACEADGVPVLRRPGGGCAVVLDPGNVVVSLVAPASGFRHSRRYLAALSAWVVDGLSRVGVGGVIQAGICDLALGDRKIAGACLRRARDHLYYSVSLLVTPRVELMGRYLKHPPREPDYRRGRAHRDFVGALGATGLSARALADLLDDVFATSVGYPDLSLIG